MGAKLLNPSQHLNQTSGNVELYSPPEILEAGRKVLGTIDLDPASSAIANVRVKAKKYFTVEDDGLSKLWLGNVWMNHPWGAREVACTKNCKKKICKRRGYHLLKDFPGNAAWVNKLISSYESGDVFQALCITYASTGEAWFKPLKRYPICFLDGRTSFYTPGGEKLNQNTKGCAVTYFGEYTAKFIEHFSSLGDVMLPATYLERVK